MTEKFTNMERADILDEDIDALDAQIKLEEKTQGDLRKQANDMQDHLDRLEIRGRALRVGRDKLANL